MKLLLHTCCAPCSVYCIDSLRKEEIEPTVYWFNPNIHPYMEYKSRRDCLKDYTKNINIDAIFEENYGLRDFCENVINDLENRCRAYCYPVRLEQTAKYAKENGYDAFSTTLLVSPYQNHEAIIEVAKAMEEKYGVKFLYRDFRVGFREGQLKARELGLYIQKYCGCIFSEEMRYYNHILSDAKVTILHNEEKERKIRLNWAVPDLNIRQHKSSNQEEREFIYNIKSKDYIQGNLTDDDKMKIFDRFMRETGKNVQIIFIREKKIGFYIAKNKTDFYFVDSVKEINNDIIKAILTEEIIKEK